jgi:4-hydroxy-tetrahydrodipicolinate reductase
VKIAIIGYGKMGKTIESLAEEMNFTVSEIYDENNPFIDCKGSNAEVAIDFTMPELAAKHIKHAADIQLPLVVGTTGWYDDFKDVSEYVNQKNASFFYATNFSIGVNLFFALNKTLAQWMNAQPNYITRMVEIHHTEKKDAPSGTAITLAEQTIENIDRLNSFNLVDEFDVVADRSHTLPIQAIREPNVPGTHTLIYESEIDKIEITHEAKGRLGFAKGAIAAARFLIGKKGIYSMSDLLKF